MTSAWDTRRQASTLRSSMQDPHTRWAQARTTRWHWGLLSLSLHVGVFWIWAEARMPVDARMRVADRPVARMAVRLIPASPGPVPRFAGPSAEHPRNVDTEWKNTEPQRRAPDPTAAPTRQRQPRSNPEPSVGHPLMPPSDTHADAAAPSMASPSPTVPTPTLESPNESSPSPSTQRASPKPSTLRLDVAPQARSAASAPRPSLIEQALNDPRSNSARASTAQHMATGSASHEPLMEEVLGDGRRRIRRGTACVDAQLSRTARLNPFDDRLRDVRVAKACD